MSSLIIGAIALAVIAAVLIRGEISHRGLRHDLEVAGIGIKTRDDRIADQQRLLRAVVELERKATEESKQ